MDEKLYQLALKLTPGVGDVLIKQLVSYCGSASEVFRSKAAKLMRIPGIGEITARSLMQANVLLEAEKELRQVEKQKIDLLFYTDERYPERLKRLYDAPALLYYRGNADLNNVKTVGIVGTRKATDYGKAMTEDIVQALQHLSPLVISGLAYGIDIAAHRTCLKQGVATLGVMASGLDIIYPALHEKTAIAMQEQGGIITENPLGAKPDAPRFPARNRIIAGMCDALIVVEAAARGGALITAEFANNYHKDVFAVPGDVPRLFSEGCNKLIQQNKAVIYTNIQDLEELLNWNLNSTSPLVGQKSGETKTVSTHNARPFLADNMTFTEEESQVISLLRTNQGMLMDDLCWQAQIPVSRLASLLLNLEFQGVVKAMPGKKFALN